MKTIPIESNLNEEHQKEFNNDIVDILEGTIEPTDLTNIMADYIQKYQQASDINQKTLILNALMPIIKFWNTYINLNSAQIDTSIMSQINATNNFLMRFKDTIEEVNHPILRVLDETTSFLPAPSLELPE